VPNNRILTTHTGSLPRPATLERAMLDRLEGAEVDDATMERLVSEATAEMVAMQRKAGIDVINDGEVGKESYTTYVTSRLEGFGGESDYLVMHDLVDFPEAGAAMAVDQGFTHLHRPACIGPISRSANADAAVARDVELLRDAVGPVSADQAFMTAVSPGTIAMFMTNRHYPDHESYLVALADAMRPEYQAIVQAGFTLQIDCPDLGCWGSLVRHDADIDELVSIIRLHLEVLDHALEGLPPEQLRMHMCWGNYEGPHHYDIPFAAIAQTVVSARPQALLIEASNPRHQHEWAVFADVDLPDGKVIVPGVIDSTVNYIEHPEVVAQRIERYASVVGRENLMATTDCGFGTFVGMRECIPALAWAKLAALVEGAELAGKRLWRATS
jgi:5-methyltetrahydropteroyltriglutamate--homocysteine methyltransferase